MKATPGRIVVELDDLASAMLRQVCREGNGLFHAGTDPRDLVNAAVTFYLADEATPSHDGFDLDCGDEALERAKLDRQSREEGVFKR